MCMHVCLCISLMLAWTCLGQMSILPHSASMHWQAPRPFKGQFLQVAGISQAAKAPPWGLICAMIRGTSQTDAAFSTKQLDLAGSTTINLLSTTQLPLWHASLLSVCFYLYFFCFFDGENKGGNSPGAELWRIPPCWSYWTIAILQPVILVIWVTLKDWRSAIILVWEDSKRSCKIGPGHSFWWLNHHQAPILLHQPMNMYRKAWTYSTHPYLSCSIILPSINKLWLPMMKVFCGSFFSRVEKSDEQTWSAKVCGAGGTERAFSGIHNTVNSSNISHLVSSFGSFFGLCYARLLGVLLLCCWERHSMPLLFPARWHL